MEEGQEKNNIINKLPVWIKNPFVLVGSAIVVIVMIYFLMPYFQSIESPFTQYNPLPIDSTYIKLDTTDNAHKRDTVPIVIDTVQNNISEENIFQSDSSNISDLFKLNTDYEELDPNEQLNRNIDDAPDDLFSQLILADLLPSEIEILRKIDLNFGIKPILKMVSTTAVEMLSGVQTKYHLDIIGAIEQSEIIQGVIVMNRNKKVIYATNRKFVNQYISEVFPRRTLIGEKLIIQELDNLQFISMPIHHEYGKIGTILLILND